MLARIEYFLVKGRAREVPEVDAQGGGVRERTGYPVSE